MNTKGYTLLEVMLFLAISGALGLTAFIGLGPRLANARFTSSIRSLESNFTKEMQESQSGLNTKDNLSGCTSELSALSGLYEPFIDPNGTVGSEPGASGTCVINGNLAVFSKETVEYYSIVSLRKKDNVDECRSITDYNSMITCYQPMVVFGFGVQTPKTRKTNYAYKVKLLQTDTLTNVTPGDISKPIAFGYVADPNTGATYQFFHTKSDRIFPDEWRLVTANTTIDSTRNRYACFGLDSRRAKVSFNTSSIKPVVQFESAECPVT